MIPRRIPRFYKGQTRDALRFIFSPGSEQREAVAVFESEMAKYLGVDFAIAVNSGRFALELLLEAYGVSAGDEIIVPAYTLKDLVFLLKGKGFVPRPLDVEQGSFNLDPDSMERLIGPRTKVILATHMFGLPCNLEKIIPVARKHGIKVIEDCAHALGGDYRGRKMGAWGDGALFSLEFTKNINTFGGGLAVTNDRQVADHIRDRIDALASSRSGLIKKILFCYLEYGVTVTPLLNLVLAPFCFRKASAFIENLYRGLARKTRKGTYRFSSLQAVMGTKQLKDLDQKNIQRVSAALRLNALLRDIPGVRLQGEGARDEERIYYQYMIRIPAGIDLYAFRKGLFLQGVDGGILSEVTDDCGAILHHDCPNAREIYHAAAQIPLFDGMEDRHIGKIASAVKRALAKLTVHSHSQEAKNA